MAASVRFDEAGRYAQIPTHGKENPITHRNVVLYESVNEVVTQYGIANNDYVGGRQIRGRKLRQRQPIVYLVIFIEPRCRSLES